MPNEFVILSPRPVDVADHLLAAVATDANSGLRSLFNGGATQVCDERGEVLATVMTTKGMDDSSDAVRLLGASVDEAHVFWTEGYLPFDEPRGSGFARHLADSVEGRLYELGGAA